MNSIVWFEVELQVIGREWKSEVCCMVMRYGDNIGQVTKFKAIVRIRASAYRPDSRNGIIVQMSKYCVK